MQKTCEMVTSDLLQGQSTKDQCHHYFRHDTAVLSRARICQFPSFKKSYDNPRQTPSTIPTR